METWAARFLQSRLDQPFESLSLFSAQDLESIQQ